MSDIKNIGEQLVNLCREGKNLEAVASLYADDATSVEAVDGAGFPQEMKGKPAIEGKGKWWFDNHQVHSAAVEGPYPHGNDRFAAVFKYDVTNKESGQRFNMDEVAVYTVAKGKIVREEFFYGM